MNNYEIVVGLEIHAELNTKSKIYCSCENRFGGKENSRCCPICAGLPGALPSLNRKVVEYAIRMGHATGCTIDSCLKQDRKNYCYPDLPKAYQISQFDHPLCKDGVVEYLLNGQIKQVRIARIHIEEDAGKLLHRPQASYSLVDLNRCGVPLIEIVTEPDIRSSAEARAFLEMIRTMLLYIGISDCKMQEGSLRCDVNVSVRPKGSLKMGTRCEMKNINTFSGAQNAIEYEAARQIAILEEGGVIEQQTRRWDDEKEISTLLRSKEKAQDYRYFSEPDIPSMELSSVWIENLRGEIPELPIQKIKRYVADYGLNYMDAEQIAYRYDRSVYYDRCVSIEKRLAKNLSNWLLGDVAKLLNEKGIDMDAFSVSPERLVELLKLLDQGVISGAVAKKVLEIMVEDSAEPKTIVEREGMAQNNNKDEMGAIVDAVLRANSKAIEEYRSGRTKVLGFLVGLCMKESGGKGNPQMINQLLLARLK